jgi:hypothetical protein
MKWVKPSGVEIETRDTEEIIEYCESLGWKRKTSRRPEKRHLLGTRLWLFRFRGRDAYVVASLIEKVKKWIAEGKQEEGDA